MRVLNLENKNKKIIEVKLNKIEKLLFVKYLKIANTNTCLSLKKKLGLH